MIFNIYLVPFIEHLAWYGTLRRILEQAEHVKWFGKPITQALKEAIAFQKAIDYLRSYYK